MFTFATMNYWLIKSEPYKYSWDELVKDEWTYWDGVKNYQARNNLKAMNVGDICLFYHSNKGLEIVGICEVIKEYYQDPTTDDERWVAVDVKAIRPLKRNISLKEIKAKDDLQEMALIKQMRLSVGPVREKEYKILMEMENEEQTTA